jgi:ABC-type multidrug transport system ATPase subunit
VSALELDRVGRHYGRAPHQRTVLQDLTLQIEPGELVAIWGLRRSGRTTLLRVAAGIEPSDSGTVCYDGHNLARNPALLGIEIAYCPREPALLGANTSMLDALTYPQLARGTARHPARVRATEALERTGARSCATRRQHELDAAEQTRVTLARALVLEPALLIIDEPLTGVDLLERDPILTLLRTLADEDTAILMSAGDAPCLAGADRALTLSHGQLHGHSTPRQAEVIPLHPRHRAA